MLKVDLEKLEMAKKEINKISKKAEKTMQKVERIVRDLNKIDEECERDIIQ